jgi:phage-related protein
LAEQAYAYVTLIPQAKGFQQGIAKELAGIGGVGGSAGKQAGQGFSGGFGGALKGLLGPITAALSTVAITNFTKSAVGAASAFSAEFEGVNQIFGTAAKSVQNFADQAAYSAGISETEALRAAKNFGGFASAAGLAGQDAASFSTSLVQAAGDLASFNDVPVDQALAAIQSGLAGQSEPLRNFRIFMDQATLSAQAAKMGFGETFSELSQGEQTLVRQAAIMGQLGVQAGDFENYAGTFGNVLKTVQATFAELQAEVGAALLPALEQLLPALLPIIDMALPILLDMFDALVPVIMALAESLGPLFTALMPLFEALVLIVEAMAPLLEQFMPIFVDLVAMLTPIILQLVKAFLPLIEKLLPPFVRLIEALLPIFQDFINFLSDYIIPLLELLADIIGDTLIIVIDALAQGFKDLRTFLGPVWEVLKPIIDGLLALAGIDAASLRKDVVINTTVTADTGEQNRFKNLAKSIIPDSITTIPTTPTTPTNKDAADAAKKAREAAVKERAALKKVIAETREAFLEARNDYQDEITAINEKFDEQREKIGKEYDKDVSSANKKFAEATADIAQRYNEAVASATESRDKSLNQALKEHNKQIATIQADFAKGQADLIQQSMDRLRNAYRSAVAINVASIFDSERIAGSIDGLVETLRDKLTASRRLIENAAKLSALGFSQTFIEQVVGSGTDVGNELAESIIGASPETVSELKSLYGSLEKESESGMDALSQKIYDQSGLATTELKNLYSKAQVQLTAAIAQQNQVYQETVAGINSEFSASIVKAEQERNKALVEAQEALDESLLEAKEKRDDALEEANKAFQDALVTAAESYEQDLIKIEKAFNEKVESMKGAARGLAGEIAAINSALAQAQADIRKPVFPGFSTGGGAGGLIPFAEGGFVNSPTAALIGEAGPEVVIPLDRFESMMGMGQQGPAVNYYAAPNQSLDSEQELFMAMKRAKVVAAW